MFLLNIISSTQLLQTAKTLNTAEMLYILKAGNMQVFQLMIPFINGVGTNRPNILLQTVANLHVNTLDFCNPRCALFQLPVGQFSTSFLQFVHDD